MSIPNLCRHATYTGQLCQDCVDDEEIIDLLLEALFRIHGGATNPLITPKTDREFMLDAVKSLGRVYKKRLAKEEV